MEIIITTSLMLALTIFISILAVTVLVFFANKLLPFKVCPICAGVSLTWLWMVIAVLAGGLVSSEFQLPIAILMGGTVVGIAYQGEKKFKWAEENIFRFKVPVIVIGFILVYFAVKNLSWLGLGIEVVVLLTLFYLFFVSNGKKEKADFGEHAPKVKELEEKMKNCC